MGHTSAGMCTVVPSWCFGGAKQKMSGSKRKVCTDWETLAYQFIVDRNVGGRRASARMLLQACDRQKWMTLLFSFLPGWVCCCSSPSPAVSGLEQDCRTALPALHVCDLMYGPPSPRFSAAFSPRKPYSPSTECSTFFMFLLSQVALEPCL